MNERMTPSRAYRRFTTRQRDWLFGGLKRSQAKWNVLAQQVLLNKNDRGMEADELGYGMDVWNGYEADRDRLLSFLRDQQISNPVVIAGGRLRDLRTTRTVDAGFPFAGSAHATYKSYSPGPAVSARVMILPLVALRRIRLHEWLLLTQGGDLAIVTFHYRNDDNDVPQLFYFDEIVGNSPALLEVLRHVPDDREPDAGDLGRGQAVGARAEGGRDGEAREQGIDRRRRPAAALRCVAAASRVIRRARDRQIGPRPPRQLAGSSADPQDSGKPRRQ